MDIALNFTLGLSQGIAWPWPIAVYLFLAGISGGAVTVAILVNIYRKQMAENTPLLKAASITGLVTILLGMCCLVADLTNPLVFWRILIYYNPTSVMSLGVMALLLYIPLVFVLTLIAFRKELKFLDGLIACFDALRGAIMWIVLILAITVCAYTGFLISVLVRFPLINQAVLPALFVASGLSAGAAAAKIIAVGCFGDEQHSGDMKVLHGAEWPIMAAEALCIFMIAVALINGNAAAQVAAQAFCAGTWATEFWVGVVGVGFILPILLNFVKSSASFYLSGLAAICGMMCLRMFILYAGQLFGL
ncbi:MAG: polysulfide reductase NrfD [Sutterella sp.]|nr:polysulfide reductase NrfD [Sutterella sp.]